MKGWPRILGASSLQGGRVRSGSGRFALRTIAAAVGVAFAPLVHSGRYHLAANSGPVFVLTALALYFYRGVVWIALPFIYLGRAINDSYTKSRMTCYIWLKQPMVLVI